MKEFEICEKKQCTGCGLCIENCPQKCIDFKEEYDGFLYPHINSNKCIGCKLCKINCPNNNSFVKKESKFYMAIHKDIEVLKKSSSGGAFTALSTIVLKNNGVVFGASFNHQNWELKHIAIESDKELDLLRRSKYYQSDLVGTYGEVILNLKKGKEVLFSGTACQIAALYSAVPNKYWDKLITVDVLCHGISNKKIVDAYIKSEEKKHRKKIVDYCFRIKEENTNWKNGGGSKIKLFFEDGSTFIDYKQMDAFYLTYNNNIILRESCYECKYCGTERISDYTIADFWGCSKERASNDQMKNGISLLVCNSDKAKKQVNDIKKYMEITPIDPSEAIPYNNAFSRANTRPFNRDTFFNMINKGEDYIKITKKIYWRYYCNQLLRKTLLFRILKKIKRIIKST